MMKNSILFFMFALILISCRFGNQATPSPVAEGGVPQAGDYELSLSNEGDTRNVVLHLPPAYDGSAQLPLIIVLHGGAGNGEQIQRLTEMDADADEYGFVVAYPDGSGRLEDILFTWNAGHCCGYALANQVDDVGFIELLIDNLVSHYAIDPAGVYITGISNGGMMAYRTGAELADKVAGIAPIAGSLGGQVTASGQQIVPDMPASPVAVMAFHGMEDEHVLYEGGNGPMAIEDGRVDLSVGESVRFWVETNGCDPAPASETQANGNIVIETYTGCDGNADVVLVTIVDGGHAWPGASRGLVSDQPTQDISANELMLEFFLAHPKE